MKNKITVSFFVLCSSLLSTAAAGVVPPSSSQTAAPAVKRTFHIKPGDGSFKRAVKNWKPGDAFIFAPGEYRERFKAVSDSKRPVHDLTFKAAFPGSVVFRGDRPAPKFTHLGNGIWKAPYSVCPEGVFERDTLSRYTYCGTVTELNRNCGTWTYDRQTKTIYLRTTDSGDPAKHVLTLGVTPHHGIDIYCGNIPSLKDAPRNVLFEGFTVTGFYSRASYSDQRIPSSQKKIPWGIVINLPQENVVIRNVTAALNGHGIGFPLRPAGAVIENCRAWGNGNPFAHSGTGIGMYSENKRCAVINNIAADNDGNDIYLYSGPFAASTKFANNCAYGRIRVKGDKEKEFKVANCVAESYTHLSHPRHLKNCVAYGYVENGDKMTGDNLLFRFETKLKPEEIFADPENFDTRPMAGVPDSVAKRSAHRATFRLFFAGKGGNDSADGRSVKNAFATAQRAQQELSKSDSELYIVNELKGNISLKNVKNVIIRGRGKFAARLDGEILLENCSNVTIERLAPTGIVIKNGSNITVDQSYGKLTALNTAQLRLTHNYFNSARLDKCKNSFVTANVFDTCTLSNGSGWSDYNAYADKVPAGEKHSFKAKAIPGRRGTFLNAWQFNGRAIDTMPVGPYRRQLRNVKFQLSKPVFKSLTPNTAVVEFEANLPFTGTISWGEDKNCSNSVVISTEARKQSISLTRLKPGKSYFVTARFSTSLKSCFSNADVIGLRSVQSARADLNSFKTPLKFGASKEYFVSPQGSNSADGSKKTPWKTVAFAINQLLPGDTLTIKGGEYVETIDVNVSGTPDRPITIRSAEGETVRFCGGYGCLLANGFRINNQSNLIFEGFQAIGKSLSDNIGYAFAPIQVNNSANITFRKLLIGGGTHRIKATNCTGIIVEDCVIAFGHEGLDFYNTDAVIRHCVFAFGGVDQIFFRNHNNEKFVLENNIICDLLLMKGSNSLIHVNDPANFTERNNCFFTRIPEKERRIFGWNFNGGKLVDKNVPGQIAKFPYLGRRQMPYGMFLKEFNRKHSAFFANPQMKILKEFIITYPDMATWKKKWKKEQRRSWQERGNSDKVRMVFENYLPNNPEVIKRGVGPRVKR